MNRCLRINLMMDDHDSHVLLHYIAEGVFAIKDTSVHHHAFV